MWEDIFPEGRLAKVHIDALLDESAYCVDLGWTIFAVAGALALVIAWLTVSSQAVKVALANPVDSLRYE